MSCARGQTGIFWFFQNISQNIQAKRHPHAIYIVEAKKMDKNQAKAIPELIYDIHGQKVMLDSDLARLYEVEAKVLNQAVKRNIERFPDDFMFQLTKDEFTEVVTKCDHLQTLKYRPTLPYAFTEQGVAMLAAVLKSQKAIDVNISIMRTFVKLRHYVFAQSATNEQITELRKLLLLYIEKNDKRVNDIIIALNNLIAQPPKTKTIGFRANNV